MQHTQRTKRPLNDASNRRSADWLPYLIIAAVAACLFGLRMAAPPTLLDQDQERPAAYVLDAVRNGHWLCQRDLTGDIASKPPLYTWLCALIAMGIGRVNQFALYLPGALAALGTAWLVLRAGRTHFGTRAGFRNLGWRARMACSPSRSRWLHFWPIGPGCEELDGCGFGWRLPLLH